MKVRDIMSPQVECVLREATLIDVARKMRSEDVGALPVVDDGEPVGLVTDRDLVCRGIADSLDPTRATASDVMTEQPRFCSQDDDVAEAMRRMDEHGVRRLLVRDSESKLCGIVSLGDVAQPRGGKAVGDLLSSLARQEPSGVDG